MKFRVRGKDDARRDGAILGGVRLPPESAGLFEGIPEGDEFFLSWLDPASPSFEKRGSPMLDLLKRVMQENLIWYFLNSSVEMSPGKCRFQSGVEVWICFLFF